jgi:hypothetical protein
MHSRCWLVVLFSGGIPLPFTLVRHAPTQATAPHLHSSTSTTMLISPFHPHCYCTHQHRPPLMIHTTAWRTTISFSRPAGVLTTLHPQAAPNPDGLSARPLMRVRGVEEVLVLGWARVMHPRMRWWLEHRQRILTVEMKQRVSVD